MLLAKRFTYIHEPKTGGTSVTHILGQLHGGLTNVPLSRLRSPALRLGLPAVSFYPERLAAIRAEMTGGQRKYGRIYNWNDHGTCSEIPLGHRSRAILATLRNPFQTYVSRFLFGWWKRPEYLPRYHQMVPDFARRYPNFPDVSFREYLELLHTGCTLPESRDFGNVAGPGWLTENFVRFYFRLPRKLGESTYDVAAVLRKIDDSYLDGGGYRDDMFRIHFIHTSDLNEALRQFLLGLGYEPADVEFIRTFKHVLPVGGARVGFADRSTSHDWPRYYTPDLMALIRRRDRLIFKLFPDLDPQAD